MDLSHLTPEQVAQLRALLLPAPASSITDVTQAAAPPPFSSSLPPPSQAPAAAPH